MPPTGLATPHGSDRRSYVRKMFRDIAPHYDRLNHILSLNIDRRWRRRAVKELGWESAPGGTYLDLCAGTLDLAAELATRDGFEGRVVGADFVLPMLALGKGKAPRLDPVTADAVELPFLDRSFEGCTVGFGIRNLADMDAGLREIARVVRPGGRAVILEFATPQRWPIRSLYMLYFQSLVPFVGRVVSKHRTAYTYLPNSVAEFPSPSRFAQHMVAAGFQDVDMKALTFGIATLYWGTRR